MIPKETLLEVVEDFKSVQMAIDAQVKCLPLKERERFYSIQKFIYQSLKKVK